MKKEIILIVLLVISLLYLAFRLGELHEANRVEIIIEPAIEQNF